jgi:hypothetical protein
MIALIAASAMYLVAGQATITGPTMALKACLKESSARAKSEKVAAAAYDAYARNACGAQIGGLRNALVGFEVKNGTKRADAAKDADVTVDDYVSSSVDKYEYLAGVAADNEKADVAAAAAKAAAAAVKPAPQATPASAPKPPK